jgi:hypothetical protein
MKVGPLSIDFGSLKVRRFGFWIPDGLHIWIGHRGVHLWWHGSPYSGRVEFDRDDPVHTHPDLEEERDG